MCSGVVKWRLTMVENDVAFSNSSRGNVYNSYLPGRGDTMIRKVVHPGRGSAIALWVVLTPANSPNVGISTA